MNDQIRRIVLEHVRLAIPAEQLHDDTDLYACGLTSHASVTLMLAIEDQLDLEFPDHLLKREVFSSVASIAAAASGLQAVAAP